MRVRSSLWFVVSLFLPGGPAAAAPLPKHPPRQQAARQPAALARLPRYTKGHSPADYARHIQALRPRLRKLKGRFTIAIQRPFVVIGDGPNVRGYARGFIKKVVTLLKKDFFENDPRILDIYLFKDPDIEETTAGLPPSPRR